MSEEVEALDAGQITSEQAGNTEDAATLEPGEAVTEPEAETTAEDSGEAHPETENNGFQKRIRELTAQRRAEQQRVAELQSQIQAMQQQAQQSASEKPSREQFESYDDYQLALIDWRTEQQVQAVQKQNVERAVEASRKDYENQVNAAWSVQREVAAARYADFDQVVDTIGYQITEDMAASIKHLDDGAEVAYHLGKNPAEVQRIASLSPYGQVAEIGRIAANLAAVNKPKASQAPAPVSRVKPQSAPVNALSDKASIKDWMEARSKQVRS